MNQEVSYQDVMIDIETLSIRPNAVVASIGFCHFSAREGAIYSQEHIRLDIDVQINDRRHVDPKTLKWWLKQPFSTINETFFGLTSPVDGIRALDCVPFVAANRKRFKARYWAKSPQFDAIILEDLAAQYGVTVPWRYDELRDARTIYELGGVDVRQFFDGTAAHNAVNDAIAQAKAVSMAFRSLA